MMPLHRFTDRWAGRLAVVVVAAGAWHNWRMWRRGRDAVSPGVPTPGRVGRPELDVPSVSVLVAAWNEARAVVSHIESFSRLGYRPLELVICAGGEDGTYEHARRLAGDRVTVLEQRAGEGKQRALQRCFEASRGEVVMLTDADCVYTEEAFGRLISPLVAGEVDVVTGLAEPLQEQRRIPFVRLQWLLDLAAPRPSSGFAAGVLGRNCALTRRVVDELAPFRTPAATGTDYVLSMLLRRAHYRIKLVPDSRIPTEYPSEPSAYLAMWRRWVKNVLLHAPRFGAWDEVRRTLVAVGLAAFTVLVPLTAPVVGRIAIAAPFAALAVGSMNRVRRMAVGARAAGVSTSLVDFGQAPVIVLLDASAVLLAVSDLASRRGRERW